MAAGLLLPVVSSIATALLAGVSTWFISHRQFRQRQLEEQRKWNHEASIRRLDERRAEIDSIDTALARLVEAATMLQHAAELARCERVDDCYEREEEARRTGADAIYRLKTRMKGSSWYHQWWEDALNAYGAVRAVAIDRASQDERIVDLDARRNSDQEFAYLKCVVSEVCDLAADIGRQMRSELTDSRRIQSWPLMTVISVTGDDAALTRNDIGEPDTKKAS